MGIASKGGIKSIQRGTITIANLAVSGTAIISSVDTTKAQLKLLGSAGAGSASTSADVAVRVVLTNATTVTATRGGNNLSVTVAFELTEWY